MQYRRTEPLGPARRTENRAARDAFRHQLAEADRAERAARLDRSLEKVKEIGGVRNVDRRTYQTMKREFLAALRD